MIRLVLPPHLRTLARVAGEVELDVEGPITQRTVLDALEIRYPMLRGTIRDPVTQERRAFVRFFACEGGFVPQRAGRLAARRSRHRGRALFDRGGHGRGLGEATG